MKRRLGATSRNKVSTSISPTVLFTHKHPASRTISSLSSSPDQTSGRSSTSTISCKGTSNCDSARHQRPVRTHPTVTGTQSCPMARNTRCTTRPVNHHARRASLRNCPAVGRSQKVESFDFLGPHPRPVRRADTCLRRARSRGLRRSGSRRRAGRNARQCRRWTNRRNRPGAWIGGRDSQQKNISLRRGSQLSIPGPRRVATRRDRGGPQAFRCSGFSRLPSKCNSIADIRRARGTQRGSAPDRRVAPRARRRPEA